MGRRFLTIHQTGTYDYCFVMKSCLPDAASFLGVGDYPLWRSRGQNIEADAGVCNNAWDSTSKPGD